MTFARPDHISDFDALPQMPAWVTSARPETLEDVAFLSGAVLSHLHVVLGRAEVPPSLVAGLSGAARGGGLCCVLWTTRVG